MVNVISFVWCVFWRPAQVCLCARVDERGAYWHFDFAPRYVILRVSKPYCTCFVSIIELTNLANIVGDHGF